jgi:hypothetical protein
MQKTFTQTDEIKQKFKESLFSSQGTLGILENKLDILPDFVYKIRFHGAENSGIYFFFSNNFLKEKVQLPTHYVKNVPKFILKIKI